MIRIPIWLFWVLLGWADFTAIYLMCHFGPKIKRRIEGWQEKLEQEGTK